LRKRQAHTAAGLKARPNAKSHRYTSNPPIGTLGFMSATQIAAGSVTGSAANGDFNGRRNENLVALVFTESPLRASHEP
jgi:hypothetical protein